MTTWPLQHCLALRTISTPSDAAGSVMCSADSSRDQPVETVAVWCTCEGREGGVVHTIQ